MPTVVRRLADLALTRSGDKGDIVDIGVFAPAGAHMAEVYEVLVEQVTAERVADLLAGRVTGPVTRYELPNIAALKLVLEGALAGGGPRSLRADNLGKALGGALLWLPITVPAGLAERLGPRPQPPADPYADAPWIVR